MGYFPVRYISRVIIYEHKMVIRLATGRTFLISTYLLSLSLSLFLSGFLAPKHQQHQQQARKMDLSLRNSERLYLLRIN